MNAPKTHTVHRELYFVLRSKLNTSSLCKASIYRAAKGDFTLELSRVETPANDEWLGAVLIQPDNRTIIGSLANATRTVDIDISCDYSFDAPGVWFSMIGTGEVYSISTCSSDLTFNAALSVSTGSAITKRAQHPARTIITDAQKRPLLLPKQSSELKLGCCITFMSNA